MSECLISRPVLQVSSSSATAKAGEDVAVLPTTPLELGGDQGGGQGGDQDPVRNSHRQSDSVHFVLQESSGYMKPSLHFLAVAHTLISFCCIIGYYCLKVWPSQAGPVQGISKLSGCLGPL